MVKKSTHPEYVVKINFALKQLRAGHQSLVAVKALVEKFGISQRQAFRYVKEAEKLPLPLPIPEVKSVFTVKLPMSLIKQVRLKAKQHGLPIGIFVTRALEFFLADAKQRQKKKPRT